MGELWDIYRREADWSLGAGEGLGSPLGWGRPVLVVDPEGPMRAGRRGALGVANSRGDSRTGGGGVEEGAGGPASSA